MTSKIHVKSLPTKPGSTQLRISLDQLEVGEVGGWTTFLQKSCKLYSLDLFYLQNFVIYTSLRCYKCKVSEKCSHFGGGGDFKRTFSPRRYHPWPISFGWICAWAPGRSLKRVYFYTLWFLCFVVDSRRLIGVFVRFWAVSKQFWHNEIVPSAQTGTMQHGANPGQRPLFWPVPVSFGFGYFIIVSHPKPILVFIFK